jgi:FkbM family methyltransferase
MGLSISDRQTPDHFQWSFFITNNKDTTMKRIVVNAICAFIPNKATRRRFRERFKPTGKQRLLADIKKSCLYAGLSDDGRIFLFNTKDETIFGHSFIHGDFWAYGIKDFFRLAQKFYPKRRGIFFDIGGNVGTTSIKAADMPGVEKVIAFEPGLENYRVFRASLALNGIEDDKIKLVNAGLSNKPGKMELEICENNFGDCRIRTDNAHNVPNRLSEQERKTQPVTVTSLDEYVKENGITPDDIGFVWIDTQGFEGFVLDGAKVITQNDIPVVMEFWPYGMKRSGCLELLLAVLKDNYVGFVRMDELSDWDNIAVHDIGKIDELVEECLEDNKGLSNYDIFLIK